MPPLRLRHILVEPSKETFAVVFAVNALFLLVVLIIICGMPDKELDIEDCGYTCLQFVGNFNRMRMKCGCRAEILLHFSEKRFNAAYTNISEMYKNMFPPSQPESMIYNGSLSDTKPLANLEGDEREDNTENRTLCTIQKWHRSTNGLLLNGMRYKNGRIRAPLKGWYHVYSIVDFTYMYHHGNDEIYGDIHVEGHSGKTPLTHAIYKSETRKGGVEEKVVSTKHSLEISQNRIYSRYNSFVSRDVYLNAGDEVYVKVTDISFAVNPPRNTFGVYIL